MRWSTARKESHKDRQADLHTSAAASTSEEFVSSSFCTIGRFLIVDSCAEVVSGNVRA